MAKWIYNTNNYCFMFFWEGGWFRGSGANLRQKFGVTLPQTPNVTVGKSLNFSVSQFPKGKMRIILLPYFMGCCEDKYIMKHSDTTVTGRAYQHLRYTGFLLPQDKRATTSKAFRS